VDTRYNILWLGSKRYNIHAKYTIGCAARHTTTGLTFPCIVSGENLVPEPQVQDETGATGEGHARGTSRGGGQRSVLSEAGRRARAGPGRQAVHQPAAWRRRQGRTDGAAVVLASADARPDAQNVVVVDDAYHDRGI